MSKEKRLSVRIDARLKQRLEDAESRTGIDEATIIRQCLIAFCDHVETHGRVVFPLSLSGSTPPRSASNEAARLNEPTAPPRKR